MIEVRKLVKDFGPIRAVDGICFKVGKGEILGFLGPNGAGKSTTMKILTCFLPPTSGTAIVGEVDVRKDSLAVRRKVGYLPEGTPLYSDMDVLGFLRFVAEVRGFRGEEAAAAVDRVMASCRLERVRHQSIDTLSKGFRQRVGFAQAILHDPPVLILDEPTDGLDPNQKHEVRDLIKSMGKEKCIILSTHILEEVEAVCTRAIIIDRGRIVADETPEGLRRRSRQHGALQLLVEADGAAMENELAELDGVEKVTCEALDDSKLCRVRIYSSADSIPLQPVLDRLAGKKCPVREVTLLKGSLDEVFRSITRKEGAAA